MGPGFVDHDPRSPAGVSCRRILDGIYITTAFQFLVCCNRSMSYKLPLHWMSQQALPSARMPFGCACLQALNFAHGMSSWVDRFPLTISPSRGCATARRKASARYADLDSRLGTESLVQEDSITEEGNLVHPAVRCICPFIVPARADCFCSYPSHEGSIARHTTLDSRGDIDLCWSCAFDVAKH